MVVRTRFAPSPTGYLHVGSARTALYSWLYAKKMGGTFILRIEDTDRERSTQEAVDAILDAMKWLGLDWQEGPFYQTHHFDRYRVVADQLLNSGHAYRCYCSKERLEKLREEQTTQKMKPRYDGHCRDKNLPVTSEPYVIRFRNPTTGVVEIDDCVRGKVVIQNSELDDLVIYRSDGTPTYNFTVVVDDWDMKVTHVIRGDDHLNNTPRQINILLALGANLPIYAHIPMILGDDGKRLSKRHGAVSVQYYRDMGILPDALLNYLVRLGWSHGDQEIFTQPEMIEYFDIHNINKAPAAFNTEKLLWLNQQYLKNADPKTLIEPLEKQFEQIGVDTRQGPALEHLIVLQRDRVKTLKEMAKNSEFFYKDFERIDPEAKSKHLTPDILASLKELHAALEKVIAWDAETIHTTLASIAERFELKLGKLAQPLRVIVTGNTTSPPIDSTLALLGQKRVLARFEKALVEMGK